MNRRTFVRSLAALAAGVTGAGCTSNQEVPATAPAVPVTGTEEEVTEVPGGNDDRFDPPTPPTGDGEGVLTVPGEVQTRRPGGPTPSPTETDGATPTRTETPTPTPISQLETGGFDLSSDDDGELVVSVTVRNESTRERSGRVLVVVEAGGETYERSKSVQVSTGSEQSLPFSFPVEYDPDVPPNVSVSLTAGTATPGGSTATDGP